MIHLYTGDGKGKTTAALGCALRAYGEGLQVKVIQFFKEGIDVGETRALKKLGIERRAFGEWTIGKAQGVDRFLIERVKEGLRQAETYIEEEVDLIVLDEVTHVVNLEIVETKTVLSLLEKAKGEIILTGRAAPQEFTQLADYVTNMVNRKHPFERGIAARRGVEF